METQKENTIMMLFYKIQQQSENYNINRQWYIKWNTKFFIVLKPKTKFNKFGRTAKIFKNVILSVIRFTATPCVKLGAKANQAIYCCSTSEYFWRAIIYYNRFHFIVNYVISFSELVFFFYDMWYKTFPIFWWDLRAANFRNQIQHFLQNMNYREQTYYKNRNIFYTKNWNC